MADKDTLSHHVHRTALAGVVGLSVQIPVIAKLCRGGTAPSPPGSKR